MISLGNNSFIGKIGGDFIFEKVEYIRVPRKIEDEFTDEEFDKVKEEVIKRLSETLDEQYENLFNKINSITHAEPVSIEDMSRWLNDMLRKSESNSDINHSNKDAISGLKKRIKYCKNPMEKKKLQQELNALYKERKRNK